MKNTLFFLIFLFTQNIQKGVNSEIDSFFLWEELNLEEAENTGFMYQDCNFINLFLESVRLGIIRPFKNDSLEVRLSQEDFLNKTRSKFLFKII